MTSEDAPIPLDADRIHELAAYRCASFDRILAYVQGAGFAISPGYTRLYRRMPRVDKFFWQPWRTLLPADAPEERVSGHAVFHHGLHHLAWQVSPGPSRGMGRHALLGESIASAANLHYCLYYHRRDGVDHPFVRRELGLYAAECERQGIELLPTLDRALRDPFGTWRRAVLELFTFSLALLDMMSGEPAPTYAVTEALLERVDTLETWPLISSYDYHNFVLHTLCHCGTERDPREDAALGTVLDALVGADSFDTFLDALLAAQRPGIRNGTRG